MSNQLVNNDNPSPTTDSNQSYYPFKSIDLFMEHNDQTNNLIFNKCEFEDNVDYSVLKDNLFKDQQLINDNLINNNNQLISDQYKNQLNSQINLQLKSQINKFNSSLLITDVLKCNQSCNQSSSSEDEFNDEKCLDQSRQNNDSALSMCSSDDSVIMITKFESLAKIMKDQILEPNDFLNPIFFNQNESNKHQLNSTSVTPSSFDQQIHNTTDNSLIESNLEPKSNLISDQFKNEFIKDSINCDVDKNLNDYSNNFECDNKQDKTLTNEQIDSNQEDDEWNFDTKRRTSAEDSLLPLKEDLADWIIRIFGKFFVQKIINFRMF